MDNFELIKLFDIYGSLLTSKRQEVFKLHYMEDLSLREIAGELNISFQAVRDSIESSKKQLIKFENALGVLKMKDNALELKTLLENNNIKDEEILRLINDIVVGGHEYV